MLVSGARLARGLIPFATTALIVAAPAIAGENHRVRPRPDLVVSGGTMSARGHRMTGHFTVRNRGTARAGRSRAQLKIYVSRGHVWTAGVFPVRAISPSRSRIVRFAGNEPQGLPAGTFRVSACADSGGAISERSESDNCRRIGKITVAGSGAPGSGSGDTTPPDPISFQKDTVFALQDPQSNYWIFVPDAYNAANTTPIELFVWMHGCGGEGSGDIYTISPGGDQGYIAISIGGREDDCWDASTDQDKVLAAIADVETHFNIDRHQVIIGGYSSGGDIAYRTAFYHSTMFAGLLAENTSPFRDTGSTAAQSLAAASFKFHVVHLAHTEDETYPIEGVRNEISQLTAAGFPVKLIERPGDHYDDSTPTSGTDHDLQTYLLPHLTDGWRSP
ncbi:MAG: CARDB domain-containing protein [Solirubrobacteraceae bacterium]